MLVTCRNHELLIWGATLCLKLEKPEGDAKFWVDSLVTPPPDFLQRNTEEESSCCVSKAGSLLKR